MWIHTLGRVLSFLCLFPVKEGRPTSFAEFTDFTGQKARVLSQGGSGFKVGPG